MRPFSPDPFSRVHEGGWARDYHRLWPQSYHHSTYSGGSICESGLSVHNSHRLQAQGYYHATYSGASIYAFSPYITIQPITSTLYLLILTVSHSELTVA